MEIAKRLEKEYGVDTPIFIDEVKAAMAEYSVPYVFKCIKEAMEGGRLIRYDDSVYYVPTQTLLGTSTLNPYLVIEKKYMKGDKGTIGFYSGWMLLNRIGGTRQMPSIVEIVTNRETMKVRDTNLGRMRLRLRRPKYRITCDNEKILQILELANLFEFDDDGKIAVVDYARKNKVGVKDILRYAKYYPAKTIKNMSEVLYELA